MHPTVKNTSIQRVAAVIPLGRGRGGQCCRVIHVGSCTQGVTRRHTSCKHSHSASTCPCSTSKAAPRIDRRPSQRLRRRRLRLASWPHPRPCRCLSRRRRSRRDGRRPPPLLLHGLHRRALDVGLRKQRADQAWRAQRAAASHAWVHILQKVVGVACGAGGGATIVYMQQGSTWSLGHGALAA